MSYNINLNITYICTFVSGFDLTPPILFSTLINFRSVFNAYLNFKNFYLSFYTRVYVAIPISRYQKASHYTNHKLLFLA